MQLSPPFPVRAVGRMAPAGWRWPLLGLLGIVVALGAAWFVYQRFLAPAPPAPIGQVVPVQRTTIASTVSATGSVVAARQSRLVFPTAGKVASIDVAVGNQVTAGQRLATLQADALQAKLDQAKSQAYTAQLKLDQLKETATPADVVAAQASFDAAAARLAQLQAGATTVDLRAAEASLLSAQAAYDQAVAKVQAMTGGTSAADITAAETSVQSARNSVVSAEAKLAQLLAGPSEDELLQARSAVEQAQTSVRTAEARLAQLTGGPANPDLVAARGGVETARVSYQAAQARLEAMRNPTNVELLAAQTAYDQALGQLTNARAKVDQFRATGNTSVELANAESALISARAQLLAAQNALTVKNDQREQVAAELEAQRKSIESLIAAADRACTKATNADGKDDDELEPGEQSAADLREACDAARLAVDRAYPGLRSAEARARQAGGPDSPEIQQARQGVATAEQALRVAELRYEQARAVPADLVAAQTSFEAAQGAVANARAKLDQLKAGPLPADLLAAQSSVESARVGLVNAEAKLAELLAGPVEADLVAAIGSVDTARSNLVGAQSKLRTLEQGPAQADLVAAETAVESARANLTAAEARFTATSVTSAQDLQAARSAVTTARAALDSARAKLDQVRAGPVEADVIAARGSVASAQSNLELLAAGPKATDLALQMEAVRQAELAVTQAEVDLQGATLVAPFDGIISAIAGNVGEQAPTGTAGFITLVDPRAVRVDVTVDETDVARLQAGKPAQITFDALQGRPFTGQVQTVSPSGTATQGVVSYPVTIRLDTRGQVLPIGMTASANIVVEQKDGVLAVPNRAVRRQGREQVVDVMGADGTPTARTVRTGVSNDQLTEVVGGLAEGERVVISGTTTRAPNTGGAAVPGLGGPAGGVRVAPGR